MTVYFPTGRGPGSPPTGKADLQPTGETTMIHVDAAMKPLPPCRPGRLLHTVSTFLLATAAAAVSIGSQQQAYCTESGSVPNIVLILADDK